MAEVTEAAPRPRVWLHLVLLVLTLVSTTAQGYLLSSDLPMDSPGRLGAAVAFSLTLLGILLSHELGHYLFARLHRVDTTLPFVLPAPPGYTFGTLGAVIRLRSPLTTRDALIDVGASGPIVGAIVALPLLVIGLRLSPIISATAEPSFWIGHDTLLSVARDFWFHRAADAASHATYFALGDSLLMRALRWVVLGKLPAGSTLHEHPVLIAAWFGLIVTSLNLFPIGQLDGGHISYAVLGPRGHRWLGELVSAGLLVLACVSSISWALWWAVSRFALGLSHPEIQPTTGPPAPLGPLRGFIAVVSLLLFIATFVPVPLDRL